MDEDIQNIELENIFDDGENVNYRVRVPKRYIRDAHNPFEFYDDREFKRRFRFSKDVVRYGLLEKVEDGLSKLNNRGLPISPVMQLLVGLRFFATGSFQITIGDTASLSQPTVSRIIFRVSALIAGHIHHVIKLPSSAERIIQNRQLFEAIGRGNGGIGLPDIDGAIDCTHIRLVDTRFQNINEVYRNRKGYFSLNVQAVVGPNTEILDIVPEWPGSQHDSRIFQNSRIYMRYMEEELTGSLVGDAGYPCLPFLLTPVNNPTTEEQLTYNIIQSRTRRVVERTFGIWKRRFPCLSLGLRTKLLTATTIVVACAVLHNLSLLYNDNLPEDDEFDFIEEDEGPVVPLQWQPADGFLIRDALIERLFGN